MRNESGRARQWCCETSHRRNSSASARYLDAASGDCGPSILNSTVNAPGQCLGDSSPAIAVRTLQLDEKPVLIRRPRELTELRIEMVEPALTTLLAGAGSRKGSGDDGPLARTELVDESNESAIFDRRPYTLLHDGDRGWADVLCGAVPPAGVATGMRVGGYSLVESQSLSAR
jgi:hypothetical protein